MLELLLVFNRTEFSQDLSIVRVFLIVCVCNTHALSGKEIKV